MNDIVFVKKSKNAIDWYFFETGKDKYNSWGPCKDESDKYEHLAELDQQRYEKEIIEFKEKYPWYESYKEGIEEEIKIKSKERDLILSKIEELQSQLKVITSDIKSLERKITQ